MAYTRPSASAADATFVGAAAYTRPSASAANAGFAAASFDLEVHASISITAGATAAHGVAGTSVAVVPITSSLDVEHTASDFVVTVAAILPLLAGAAVAHGMAGNVAASVGLTAGAAAGHGIAGEGVASIGLSASISAAIERYELSGEVRLEGILVNRRVRAYRRDTGVMVSEADTVAGRFKLPAGFTAGVEFFVVPVDLDEGATDWSPPVANRVVPIMASDTA